MRYTTHQVHITECHSNLSSEEQEDITVMTMEFNLGSYATAERALLEGWNKFYGEALDNGQESQQFMFTFVDEATAEVKLYPNFTPDSDASLAGEVFTLRLEV